MDSNNDDVVSRSEPSRDLYEQDNCMISESREVKDLGRRMIDDFHTKNDTALLQSKVYTTLR